MKLEKLEKIDTQIKELQLQRKDIVKEQELELRKALKQLKKNHSTKKIAPPADQAAGDKRAKVAAVYADPANHDKTWSGRGKQPTWVRDYLAQGKALNDLRIESGNGSNVE